jgi:hypothetical protein
MLHRESVLGNYSRPIRIEDVDEAVADTRLIVLVVRRLLLRERDPELSVDVVNPKRSVAGRDRCVGERRDVLERLVEDVDRVLLEVRRVEEVRAAVRRHGETFVHRVIRRSICDDLSSRSGTPSRDRSVLAREDEHGLGAAVDQEVGGRVEHLPGRLSTRRPARSWDGDNERELPARTVVQRREMRPVIAYPQGAARAEGESPGVHQVGIDECCAKRCVIGDELRFLVRRGKCWGCRVVVGARGDRDRHSCGDCE